VPGRYYSYYRNYFLKNSKKGLENNISKLVNIFGQFLLLFFFFNIKRGYALRAVPLKPNVFLNFPFFLDFPAYHRPRI
jgi:hypothetical protein